MLRPSCTGDRGRQPSIPARTTCYLVFLFYRMISPPSIAEYKIKEGDYIYSSPPFASCIVLFSYVFNIYFLEVWALQLSFSLVVGISVAHSHAYFFHFHVEDARHISIMALHLLFLYCFPVRIKSFVVRIKIFRPFSSQVLF